MTRHVRRSLSTPLLLPPGAWLIHSFFDGIILGSSESKPSVMLPLTFAILVCAMQVCHILPIAFLAPAYRAPPLWRPSLL